ncbi:putative persephin [Sesbania bispinosa]|nr:putative persephin [Sesbania bispinosa]
MKINFSFFPLRHFFFLATLRCTNKAHEGHCCLDKKKKDIVVLEQRNHIRGDGVGGTSKEEGAMELKKVGEGRKE